MLTQLKQQSDFIMQTLASEMLDELKSNILPFWMYRAIDTENGGFYGEITNDLSIHYEANKGGILHSRILWTFSSSYRILKDTKYLKVAEHAYAFICASIWDNQYGGVYWMVNPKGQVINDRKQAYNLAFSIYGLTEYYRAVQNEEALSKAKEVFYILEKYFKDPIYGGYFEARSRDYSPIIDVRLSEKERNDAKSMNTSLHILEAYTNLYRVWQNDALKHALKALLVVVLDKVVDQKHFRFQLFFDEAWNSTSHIISFGHDIEGSWLICEAADVLNDIQLKQKTCDIAMKMAYGVLEHGMDHTHGGIYNEEDSGVLDTDKHWWPQAEAVVGYINAFKMTQDERFLKTACETWSFIENHIIDKQYGEWFWRTDRVGEPYLAEPKVEPWKCPYHNGRACLEINERVHK